MRRPVEIVLEGTYPELGVRSFGKATFHKPDLSGAEVGNKKLFRIDAGALPRGHGVLVISTGSGWLTLGRPVTAHPTDATAERVLQVGDGGLLATAPVTVSLNAMMPAGTYTYVFSDPAIPSSGSGAVIVLRSAATVNFQAQIASPLTGGAFLRRTQDAGVTWTPWERIVTLRGLLGTVSQSGGVPTGAVLERGSNANGDYLRLADGTQICWITAGLAQSVPAGAYVEASWTYPAVFVSGSVPQPRVAVRSFNDATSRQTAARHLSWTLMWQMMRTAGWTPGRPCYSPRRRSRAPGTGPV